MKDINVLSDGAQTSLLAAVDDLRITDLAKSKENQIVNTVIAILPIGI